MLISLPSQKWFKKTDSIRPGSLIEYEYYTDALGIKMARALALVVRVGRSSSASKSHVVVLSPGSLGHLRVRLSDVCRVIVI